MSRPVELARNLAFGSATSESDSESADEPGLAPRLRALMDMTEFAIRPASQTPINGELSPHRRLEWLTMPLEDVRALQATRLGAQLDRVWDTPVPFFKRKYEAAGLRRADIRGLDGLRQLPTTVKAELRESEAAHPPFGDYRGAPVAEAVRLGASTGTSGRPTLILWTRKDLAVDHAASARGRWRWGLRPGMSLANAHPFGMNAGGWHFSHGVEALDVLNVPSGPPVGDAHVRDVIEVWRRIKPDMYRLFGNVATTYAEAARRLGLDPVADLNLRMAGDHPSQQYLMASSGLEALPLLGSACDEHDGAHLAEDLAIVSAIQRSLGCGANEFFTFGHFESAIAHFHRTLKAELEVVAGA